MGRKSEEAAATAITLRKNRLLALQGALNKNLTMLMIITMMMVMVSMMMFYILEPGKAVGGRPGHEAVCGKECGQDECDQHLCNDDDRD